MASRIELGGYRPSRGDKSFGELRAQYYVDVPDALKLKALDFMTNHDGYSNLREVYADMLAGEFDDELAEENEVDPSDYDREEWVSSQEDTPDSDD